MTIREQPLRTASQNVTRSFNYWPIAKTEKWAGITKKL